MRNKDISRATTGIDTRSTNRAQTRFNELKVSQTHLRRREEGESSIQFIALFENRHGDKICAENGADGNILDELTLRRIIKAGVEVDVEEFHPPKVLDMESVNTDG